MPFGRAAAQQQAVRRREDSSLVSQPSIVIGYLGIRAASWLGIALFSALAVFALFSNESKLLSLGFLGFAALNLYCIVAVGPVVLDEQQIMGRCAIGTFQILWDEVIAIDKDPRDIGVVFRGRDKRLVIPGPRYWGRSREAAWTFVKAQARARELTIHQTVWAAYGWSRGVRVKSR